MAIKVKPTVTKRVDFSIPRGTPYQGPGHRDPDSASWRWIYEYKSDADAIAARSIEWHDNDEMVVGITKIKDKLLFLVGPGDYDNRPMDIHNAYFKLTTTIAKKLIQRALAAPVAKQVRPTDAEKEAVKGILRASKKGPVFERIAGRGNLFTFTAPCGEISVLKQATLESILDAIVLAEKELK